MSEVSDVSLRCDLGFYRTDELTSLSRFFGTAPESDAENGTVSQSRPRQEAHPNRRSLLANQLFSDGIDLA